MNILRVRDVARVTGLSRTTLWRLERRGEFPRRLRLAANSVGWIESEIRAWIETRPRGMTGGGPLRPGRHRHLRRVKSEGINHHP